MKKIIFSSLLLFMTMGTLKAQSVGIGTDTPNPDDQLHIAAPKNVNGLLVQIKEEDKFRVHANGGTTIGSGASAPDDGLYIEGVTNPFGGIRSGTNPISIQSTNDSVEIMAGSNKIVVFAHGGIKIITSTGTEGITIDAGGGDLVLKGNTVSIEAADKLNIAATKILATTTDSIYFNSTTGNTHFNSTSGSINLTSSLSAINLSTLSNNSINVISFGDMLIKSSANALMETSANLTLKAGLNLNVQASANYSSTAGNLLSLSGGAQTKINGGIITLNNGVLPAARLTDLVNVPGGGGGSIGIIATGSNTVFIGN